MSQALCSSFTGLSLGARPIAGQRISTEASANSSRKCAFVIEAAHKKGSGSTKNGRDSVSKRRGIKVYGMQPVKAGGIIVRQVGATFHAGTNTKLGKDFTLFALEEGIVMFEPKHGGRKKVSVYPADHPKVLAKQPVPVSNGNPTRRERRRAMYTPRAQQREEAAPATA